MRMLSIRSAEELLLVKSMLRSFSEKLENTDWEQFLFDKYDPKYYSHIGKFFRFTNHTWSIVQTDFYVFFYEKMFM